jgi:PhoPQ-activated pathogenicity-related protein
MLGFNATALDEYVAKEDSTYSWVDTGERIHGNIPTSNGIELYTGYVLNMTSQAWLTEEDSSRPIWWHILVVIIPENVKEEHKDWSFIYITGGNNEGSPDKFKWDD